MKLWLSDASDCVYTLYVFVKKHPMALANVVGKILPSFLNKP